MLVVVPGCLVGGGPVVTLRKSKVALGFEASGNVFAFGAEGGTAGGVSYGGLRYLAPLRSDENRTDQLFAGMDYEHAPHVSLMAGYGGGDGDRGLAIGAAGMAIVGERDCFAESYLFSVAVGVRMIGGVGELYVAPKANFNLPAPCD
jgi:hypothetical protein